MLVHCILLLCVFSFLVGVVPPAYRFLGGFLFLLCACIVLVVVDQDRSRGFPAVSEFITGDLSPSLPPLIVLFVL